MPLTPNIIITTADHRKLSALLRTTNSDLAEQLEEELSRAAIVEPEQFPNDAVSMNSKVSFVDLGSGTESTVTLVYPHDADIEKNQISILAPVGTALIGLRVGQIIDWPLPHGKEKRLKLVSVLQQPDLQI